MTPHSTLARLRARCGTTLPQTPRARSRAAGLGFKHYVRSFSRAVSRLGKSVLAGDGDRLGAVTCVDLGEQVVDVTFDGAFADGKVIRDLVVGHACGDERQYLGFPGSETRGKGWERPAAECRQHLPE